MQAGRITGMRLLVYLYGKRFGSKIGRRGNGEVE
jgi:hypothetical protein